MRASRAFAATVAACAAVGLAAPAAVASSGPGNVNVNPFSVHQGGRMTVSAAGCTHGGTVTSNAFPTARLSAGATGYATAKIRHNATPGHYNLAVKCNDNPLTATHQYTVLAARGAQGGLGGSLNPSDTEMAVGAALVGTAAIGGGIFIMRRRRMNNHGS
ncbi:hypothetical protein [Streptomyces spiramyceticus]|uniref:hypothetical protein n=1 Tax=Streptomyces spiramyceticus TaxID=299717 RepID=UPI00237BF0D8|nr:hypothetical protein [Streptomyces spiramyceticus]